MPFVVRPKLNINTTVTDHPLPSHPESTSFFSRFKKQKLPSRAQSEPELPPLPIKKNFQPLPDFIEEEEEQEEGETNSRVSISVKEGYRFSSRPSLASDSWRTSRSSRSSSSRTSVSTIFTYPSSINSPIHSPDDKFIQEFVMQGFDGGFQGSTSQEPFLNLRVMEMIETEEVARDSFEVDAMDPIMRTWNNKESRKKMMVAKKQC